MSFKSTSVAAAVALTLWGAGAEARDFNDMFTLRGYGTAGLVYSDEDQADFVIGNTIQQEGAGFSDEISAAVDSKSALQLDMTFTDRFSGVVQIMKRQQEGWSRRDPPPIRCDATTGHDHVDVRMVGHGRTQGMEHGGHADAGAQMFWVGRDGQHGLGCRLEQQVVDQRLVVEGDVGDLGG